MQHRRHERARHRRGIRDVFRRKLAGARVHLRRAAPDANELDQVGPPRLLQFVAVAAGEAKPVERRPEAASDPSLELGALRLRQQVFTGVFHP